MNMHCVHRDYQIIADLLEHPGLPTPWEGGCRITAPDGRSSARLTLPVQMAFLAELDSAQRASVAHGKWLIDQHLDHGRQLFGASRSAA
jgi:hypothetical protein